MQDEETPNERYLFACKHCYMIDPQVVVELDPQERTGPFGCCGSKEYVFLHESVIVSKNGEVFCEYQIVRPRLSTTMGTSYCKRRDHCDKGSKCTFVHTYQEMCIWKKESRDHYFRQCLANLYWKSLEERIFHCSFCALNFKWNSGYVDHLNGKFHQKMTKYFKSREDTEWKYKPSDIVEKCKSISDLSSEQCGCNLAHSESEYQEWKKRAAVYQARNDYAKEGESYLTKLQERINKGDVIEMESSYNKEIERNESETHWDCTFQLPSHLKISLKQVCILGDCFKMKFTDDTGYHKRLKISHIAEDNIKLRVRFLNPGVYEEYDGKLFLNFGDEMRLPFVNFRVTVSDGMPTPYRDCFQSRIVISYPTDTSHESEYEENLQKQLLKYRLPKSSYLTDVYIQSLTPENYVKNMHNFLFQEETARRAVLSKLSLECEITFSQHIFIPSGTVLGNKGNGSLYGQFQSPTRLSTDSDEGFLARDSCKSVLIGVKENSIAYECKIEDWCDKDVFIHVPPRCVNDLKLKNGVKSTLLIQYKLDRIKFCRMHYSLDCLLERVKLLCPSPNSYATLTEHGTSLRHLDQSQNLVLKQVLGTKQKDFINPGKKCFPPLLVAGPFGTGKTHTIQTVIQQVFQTSGHESRVLLCTHSNSAADLYIQDIHKSNWDTANYKVLRIMYHNRKPNAVLVEDVRNFCLYTEDGTKFRYPKMEEILKYHIIITTFSTAPALGQLGIGLRSNAFTHIFLDEASQAMEPEVIMPLTLACAENTRVVIAGDHKQINEKTFLPKTVSIPTLLERMYHAYGDYSNLHSYKILLCNNYRTVDGLLQLISELFYKVGILQCSGDVQTIHGYHPVYFTHVEGDCVNTPNGDYINVLEAEEVVNHVVELTGIISQEEILVTSPYYSQVKLIRDLLRKKRLKFVIVYRAANVQALQYKVVILSCVVRRITCLKSEGDNFGFLSDENLLNTVLTRAKSLVIAIGDASTLCAGEKCAQKWLTFLKHCETFGTIHPHNVTVHKIQSQILRADATDFHPKGNGHILQPDEAYEMNHNGDAENFNPTNSAAVGNNFTSKDADDDLILYDMLEKRKGNSTVKQNGTHEKSVGEVECYDPNEPELYSNMFADREPFTPKHNLGELEHMLSKNPKRYRRCKIHFRTYCLADAYPIGERGGVIHEEVIKLDGKENVGRTFNNDVVLVELTDLERRQNSDVPRLGKVVGIFERFRKIHQEPFLCKPFETNTLLMVPMEKACTLFTIKTPKNHRQTDPDKIPIYKIKTRKAHFTNLELVSCEKVDWDCVYAVRYIKWSEYCRSPFGFVEHVYRTDQMGTDDRLKISLGISIVEKPSVTQQVKNAKIPEINSEGDVNSIFTIDPEGAIDLDDGLSLDRCLEHKDCYLLGVHITDVASLVEKNSPIDKMAHDQKSTLYGPDSTMHMLPKDLVIGKCSLLKNQHRAAISTYFHSSQPPPHIGRKDNKYVVPRKSHVISKRQFTYREAEDMLKTKMTDDDQNPRSMTFQLKKIWEILWSWRVFRLGGAAFYRDYENYSDIAAEGKSHLLIEEAMLAVNANAAAYLIDKKFYVEVKVQGIPEHEKWKKWRERNKIAVTNSPYLSSTDDFIMKRRKEDRKFTRVPESMRNRALPEPAPLMTNQFRVLSTLSSSEDLVENVVDDEQDGVKIYSFVWEDICRHMENEDYDTILMTLALDYLHPSQVTALDELHDINEKARWTTHSGGNTLHSSLRLLLYTRCTSPIRRYPDIVIQRYLISALEGNAPPQKTEKANSEIDERFLKLKRDLEMQRYARILKEQPVCEVVSLSMVTDAGLRMFFSASQDNLPLKMKNLDYGHLMLDMRTKDFLEQVNDERRNQNMDLILEKIDAVWKFRYYDYQKDISKISTAQHIQGLDITKTLIIPKEQWQKLVRVMSNPPGLLMAKSVQEKYQKSIKTAIHEFTPIESEEQSVHDRMCGKTRNAPSPIRHLREIKRTLGSSSVIQVQISSSSGRQHFPEPCIQLLQLAKDLSICVQHNKEALLTFAADAEKMITHQASQSLDDYTRKWEPLIRLDGAYNAVTDGSSIFMSGIKIFWEKLDLLGQEHEFSLEHRYCRERYIGFHRGDLLCLRLAGVKNSSAKIELNACNTYTIVLHGYVSSVTEPEKVSESVKVRFRLFDQHVPESALFTDASNLWTVEIVALTFMHRHLQSALRKLLALRNILVTKIVLRRSIYDGDNRCNPPESCAPLVTSCTLDGFPNPLNDEQQIQKVRCLTQKFTLVQGPPGTGKSYMGAQIAACFSIINRVRDPEGRQKVLYCGPSNKAVDVAAGFLKDADNVKVVRMYSKSLEEKIYPNPIKPPSTNQSPGEELKMPDKKLDDIALHEMIRNVESEWQDQIISFDERVKDSNERFTRDEVNAYQEAVTKAKMQILKEADIIICTCSLSAQLGELKEMKESLRFTQCIIDECGMCSEPETLIPIVTSDPGQVVLIGDHKQLQPVIKCKKAEMFGLGQSLFSQYSDKAQMLKVQYRMNHEIMETPSKLFYDGKLIADTSIDRRTYFSYFPRTKSNNIFWNIVGKEKEQKFRSVRGGRRSKYNEQEAVKVVELLQYLTENSDLAVKDIMVLSPYTAQCTRIQYLLRKNESLRKVHVGSVVTSQGSEAKFVILSTVRSMVLRDIKYNPELSWQRKHLGFVTDPHQVNVALTRARLGLCIIGNKNLLQTCTLWEEIIQSYYARDAVYDRSPISDSWGIGDYSFSGIEYEHEDIWEAYSWNESSSESRNESSSESQNESSSESQNESSSESQNETSSEDESDDDIYLE